MPSKAAANHKKLLSRKPVKGSAPEGPVLCGAGAGAACEGVGGAGVGVWVAGGGGATVGSCTVHTEQVPSDEVTVLTISVVPAGRLVATVTTNGTVIEPGPATVTSWVQGLLAWLLGLHLQPAPVEVVLAGTVSVRVVVPGLPPELVTVRWYTSTSFGPTCVVGPAGVPFTENRVFTVSNAATVGVLTVHDEQLPVDEVTVLTIVAVPAGRVAATVTSNGTVIEPGPATVTSWVQGLPAWLLGLHLQPAPVKVVLAGTFSVSVVDASVPPPLVTVRW